MAQFFVEAEFDQDAFATGWDGYMPLDAKRSWTPYMLTLYRRKDDGDHELIDSLGSTWASDDASGQRFIRHIVNVHFCRKNDADYPRRLADITINIF